MEAARDVAAHVGPLAQGAKTRRARVPLLRAAVATGFERSEPGALRAVIPAEAKRGVRASGEVFETRC